MRLIDADDFGNRMYHEAFEKDSDLQKWDSGCWIRYKLFENVLREQPSAQPERKRGKWIGGDGSYICSECSSSPMDFIETMGLSFDAYVETPMNFCPNCGADMRGVRYKCHA